MAVRSGGGHLKTIILVTYVLKSQGHLSWTQERHMEFDLNPNVATLKKYCRVATAQREQGIWILTFPGRQNMGDLVYLILTQGKLWKHRENFALFVESLAYNVIVE